MKELGWGQIDVHYMSWGCNAVGNILNGLSTLLISILCLIGCSSKRLVEVSFQVPVASQTAGLSPLYFNLPVLIYSLLIVNIIGRNGDCRFSLLSNSLLAYFPLKPFSNDQNRWFFTQFKWNYDAAKYDCWYQNQLDSVTVAIETAAHLFRVVSFSSQIHIWITQVQRFHPTQVSISSNSSNT